MSVHLLTLQEAGLLGMDEQGGATTIYLRSRPAALPFDGEWSEVEQRDWLAIWREGLDAVVVGALTIVPPWIDRGPGAIVIEPGQAFGTGHHETTTGCLAALQELDLTGRSVLDVGTGSGILAIAAARLGARPVVAVDIEREAVEAATANAAVNAVAIEVRPGSLAAAPGRHDVVVANLDTSTVTALAPDLAASLAPAGTLIVSGVSIERQAEAVTALAAAGLTPLVRPGREWVVLVARANVGLHG